MSIKEFPNPHSAAGIHTDAATLPEKPKAHVRNYQVAAPDTVQFHHATTDNLLVAVTTSIASHPSFVGFTTTSEVSATDFVGEANVTLYFRENGIEQAVRFDTCTINIYSDPSKQL